MILVTGGTGLVGAHLLYRLKKSGASIRASYRSEARIDRVREVFRAYAKADEPLVDEIEWVNCNLLNTGSIEDLLEGIDEVFHCAALVSFHPKDKWRLLEDNPKMTAHLVNESLRAGVNRFNYVSSVAALGRPPEKEQDKALDESNVWKDSPENSAYTRSKYRAELEVWRGMEEGLRAAMVNPAIILGCGFPDEGSSAIFGMVDRGFSFYTPGMNGFVDVRDVVEGLMKISERDIHAERYVLVSENLPYRELFGMIATGLGKRPPHRRSSPWMIQLIRLIHAIRELFGGRRATITRETAASAVRQSRFNNAKARNDLDIRFIPIKESVEHVCKWMRERP